MSTKISRLLALAYLSTITLSIKEFESDMPFVHYDLTSLENFRRSVLNHPTHSHQKLLEQRAHGSMKKETSDDKGTLVFFVSPISLLPMAVLMDDQEYFKIATFDFNSKFTTFALPLLLRGVSNVHKPSSEMNKVFSSVMTPENDFKCHSFFSEDYTCFRVNKDEKSSALYVKVAQKFDMFSIAELQKTRGRIPFSESKAMMLPVGFEYSETGRNMSLLSLKDTIGLAPVKTDDGKVKNTFLQTAFESSKSKNKNYKITSMTAEHVRIWILGNLPYDIIEPSFEVGVEDKLEDFPVVGKLHQESTDKGGKFYVGADKATFGAEEIDGITKMQYNPSFPGFGFPQRVIDKMIKDKKYKMQALGDRFYVILMDLDDSTKVTVEIEGKKLEIVVSDALGTWERVSRDSFKAVIFVEAIPEDDTIELGYLPMRRYSILVDVEEQKMGFKLDN